jgi:hypothetical protein
MGARAGSWLPALLGAGVVLIAADLVLAAVLVSSTPPAWLWGMLAITPWGPIALVAWWLITRYRRRVRYMRESGVAGRATVRSIHSTGSVVNGRPVLRLDVSVQVPGRPVYETSVRNAPPIYMAGILRPGVSLPVKADPQTPARILIDWAEVERETSPGVSQQVPGA